MFSFSRVWNVSPVGKSNVEFSVESESNPEETYAVDLTHWNFNGSCDCPHFLFQCKPVLQIKNINVSYLQCKHIIAARNYLLEKILPEINKIEMTPAKGFTYKVTPKGGVGK